ncbi:hypothetical protein T484DRAFT_1857712 [Baffinella frigidus]|nr:hypothetical protein T484DRAFT_1857712 [Cryptophyta sp. CCMP2293]
MKDVGDKRFELILRLPPGEYEFKFIVNTDSWICSGEWPTASDDGRNLNNAAPWSARIKRTFPKKTSTDSGNLAGIIAPETSSSLPTMEQEVELESIQKMIV